MSQGRKTQEELSPLKRAILELREMRAKLDEMDRRQKEPIAIVGIGLRLPGGAPVRLADRNALACSRTPFTHERRVDLPVELSRGVI